MEIHGMKMSEVVFLYDTISKLLGEMAEKLKKSAMATLQKMSSSRGGPTRLEFSLSLAHADEVRCCELLLRVVYASSKMVVLMMRAVTT